MAEERTIKTLDQRRAKLAWSQVGALVKGRAKNRGGQPDPTPVGAEEAVPQSEADGGDVAASNEPGPGGAKSDGDGKKYRTLAQRLPAMIMTNGLGQTLAFLLSKPGTSGRSVEVRIATDLAGWLLCPDSPISWEEPDGHRTPEALMCLIQNSTSVEYRQAATEVLQYVTWLKRFAVARLEGE